MKPHTTTLVKIRKNATLPNGLERFVYKEKDFNVAYVMDKTFDGKNNEYTITFWNGYLPNGDDRVETYKLPFNDIVGSESTISSAYVNREDY